MIFMTRIYFNFIKKPITEESAMHGVPGGQSYSYYEICPFI